MEKAKTEIDMKKGDKLYKFCPYCGGVLELHWQHIREDDANPVRFCFYCDVAWVWHIYD